jgi:hypothetical protein
MSKPGRLPPSGPGPPFVSRHRPRPTGRRPSDRDQPRGHRRHRRRRRACPTDGKRTAGRTEELDHAAGVGELEPRRLVSKQHFGFDPFAVGDRADLGADEEIERHHRHGVRALWSWRSLRCLSEIRVGVLRLGGFGRVRGRLRLRHAIGLGDVDKLGVVPNQARAAYNEEALLAPGVHAAI